MGAINPPLLLGLIVCDTAIREEGTHKLSLIGTFNGLFASRFPCVHPFMAVYVALTDGRGLVPCSLRLAEIETNKEVMCLKGQVKFDDPRGVAEMVFPLHGVRFERAGEYAIEFVADGEMLGTRRLRVQPAPPPPPPPQRPAE